mgnify:FL=1|jgi:hypothetical protein
MNRYGWMVVRAYLPAVAALLLAVLAMFWTSAVGSIDALNALVPYAKWITPIALLAALVSGGITTLRMWHWQRGETPACKGCGGALGRLRHAPTGDYRKCLCCGGKHSTSP